jgi:Sec-independent protein translocase protein TatA
MFGIDFPEMVVLAALALVLLGPEKLTEYAAKLGRFVARMRQASAEVTQPLQAALRPDLTPPPTPSAYLPDQFCQQCGMPLDPGFAFCPRCGRARNQEPPAPPPPPPPT